MTTSAYVRAAAMRHKVIVIEGLKEITHELKGVGRNLNQLTVLSNMGRISEVNLTEVLGILGQIYLALGKLTEQERR